MSSFAGRHEHEPPLDGHRASRKGRVGEGADGICYRQRMTRQEISSRSGRNDVSFDFCLSLHQGHDQQEAEGDRGFGAELRQLQPAALEGAAGRTQQLGGALSERQQVIH